MSAGSAPPGAPIPPDPPAGDLFDLADRVVVVTGGSRGLGLEMSRGFARSGANVVVASRKLDVCEAVAAEIQNETGREAMGCEFHAGRWTGVERLLDAVDRRFGRLDVMVNNAGMSPAYENLADVTELLFDKVVGVNFKGPFRLCVAAAERMAADRGGSIVNISSIAAVQPRPSELVYAGCKAALNAITVGVAYTYGPNVRCNAIMPGPFRTDITDGWDWKAFNERARTSIPMHRIGWPYELVGAALYLASDASSYTTGSVLKVDGGTTSSLG